MIPGPYYLCVYSEIDDGSDGFILTSVKWGYDTAEKAFSDIPEIAKEKSLPKEELVVIRWIDKEEAMNFTK